MKRLFFASMAVMALASCSKESIVDTGLPTADNQITYSPYAGASATRGTAVNSNVDFQKTPFKLASHNGASQFFAFEDITYANSVWSGTDRYWPAEHLTLHFGGYSPNGATGLTNAAFANSTDGLTFDYAVGATVGVQQDLMFAVTSHTADALTDAVVGLHFKHALTQIAFTATKQDDITVNVRGITICNVVGSGEFAAKTTTNDGGAIDEDQDKDEAVSAGMSIWTPATKAAQSAAGSVTTNLNHYAAVMASDATEGISVTDKTTAVALTHATNVMMLMPQELTAWTPVADAYDSADETTNGRGSTDSYLAIDCKITGPDASVVVDGVVYIPFDTDDIPYVAGNSAKNEDGWKSGYKITYNLAFGGGYTYPGEGPHPTPTPGEVPDPDEVIKTLRSISYTVTVDEWIEADDTVIL